MINKHIQRLRTAEDGFDLVQALVVVVILGALATIAAITLLGQADKGEKANVVAGASQAVNAAKALQVETGTNSWASGIGTDVIAAVDSPGTTVTAPQPTGTNPLVITVERGDFECQASIALATQKVTYTATPSGSCPN